jgi:hypothetical protein
VHTERHCLNSSCLRERRRGLSAIKQRGRPSFLFHGSGQIHLGHAICEDFRLGVIEIGQNDHREFVIHKAGDLRFEALLRSFVFDDPVTVLGDDKPAKKARSLLGSRQIRHLIEHKLRGDPAHSLQHVAWPRRISSTPASIAAIAWQAQCSAVPR